LSSTLASEKAEIESERTTLEALEAQVENLGREIRRVTAFTLIKPVSSAWTRSLKS